MLNKSTFEHDLKKERTLHKLLDSYYQKQLKQYDFERIDAMEQQMQGIDVIFRRKSDGAEFLIDEKAQLDYVNEELPTFAFELNYQKKGKSKQGWLFDKSKKTHFYSLVTAIYSDEPGKFTSCKVTFVNREKLIRFLESRNITKKDLETQISALPEKQGKSKLGQFDHQQEGYLFFSSQNKAEKPVNLILKLDFLIQTGVAKRLI